MSRTEKLQLMHRLAFQLIGIVNTCEICTSKLRNNFLDDNDYKETKKTICRLQAEILELDRWVVNSLDISERN